MIATEDHALMLAVRDGRTAQLSTLFERHHVALYNFFRKMGHDRSDSEDLLQESFLRMLRYAASYSTEGHFGSWMYSIARHVAIDASSRAKVAGEDIDALELKGGIEQEPDAAHAMAELGKVLHTALLRLPRDKRELILLSRVRLLETAHLAELFECSPGAIKVRLHRSLELLRHHYDALRSDTYETSR